MTAESMTLSTKALGPRYGTRTESDIIAITYADGFLRFSIDAVDAQEQEITVQIEFDGPRGFRVLDEGDLIAYWQTDSFPRGYHLFEVLAGGWLQEETELPHMLSISRAMGCPEWFVATTNTCASVLCVTPPRMSTDAG